MKRRINGIEVPIKPLANLRGANLYGANLDGANLYGANLYGANLYGANLDGANLYGANLDGANLRGANLDGANLYGANLGGANLRGANLDGANLRGADGYYSLPVGDERGYWAHAILCSDGWHIRSGCRDFTITEAKEHWLKPGACDGISHLAERYLYAISWLEKMTANSEESAAPDLAVTA